MFGLPITKLFYCALHLSFSGLINPTILQVLRFFDSAIWVLGGCTIVRSTDGNSINSLPTGEVNFLEIRLSDQVFDYW